MSTETLTRLEGDAQRLHLQATAQHRESERVISTLTLEQWIWSPDTQTWNIALILDHLNILSNLMLPKIDDAIGKLRADNLRSDGPFHYNLMERLFIRILSPDPPFKVPVPPLYVPKIHADPATEIGPNFLENQRRFLRGLEDGNGLDWKKIKISSSAFGWMKLTLGGWLEANVAHEQYHWLQVKALQSHPNFPRAG